jgi:hypothetical protein
MLQGTETTMQWVVTIYEAQGLRRERGDIFEGLRVPLKILHGRSQYD